MRLCTRMIRVALLEEAQGGATKIAGGTDRWRRCNAD
jgi:hypothetical protein